MVVVAPVDGDGGDDDRGDPELIAFSLAQARMDAEIARRKRVKARVYRRGGYLMLGLLAITALLSVLFVVMN